MEVRWRHRGSVTSSDIERLFPVGDYKAATCVASCLLSPRRQAPPTCRHLAIISPALYVMHGFHNWICRCTKVLMIVFSLFDENTRQVNAAQRRCFQFKERNVSSLSSSRCWEILLRIVIINVMRCLKIMKQTAH